MDAKYKTIYTVDMGKVFANRFKYLAFDNSVLPIKKRNGKPTKNEFIRGCSYDNIEALIKQFSSLSKTMGTAGASTIIEYIDMNGQPVAMLYPMGTTDFHTNKISNHDIISELLRLQDDKSLLVAEFSKYSK